MSLMEFDSEYVQFDDIKISLKLLDIGRVQIAGYIESAADQPGDPLCFRRISAREQFERKFLNIKVGMIGDLAVQQNIRMDRAGDSSRYPGCLQCDLAFLEIRLCRYVAIELILVFQIFHVNLGGKIGLYKTAISGSFHVSGAADLGSAILQE